MGKIVNVREVQKALDRAARDARHGPVDVRAGRFVHGNASSDRLAPNNGKGERQGKLARDPNKSSR